MRDRPQSADPKDRSARARLGKAGEALAEIYLTGLGFRVLARQHRCRRGEVDLVAEEGDCLCFVEVRSRSPGPVGPLESVTVTKQRRVIRAALDYLVRHRIPMTGARAMRFDVVEIHRAPDGQLRPELCRNAFEGFE